MSDKIFDDMESDADAAKEAEPSETLRDLGMQALQLDSEINQLEEDLKKKKKALERLFKFKIPAALTAADVDEFSLKHDDGTARIKVETKVVGSLSYAEDIPAAVEYLEASGLRGVVKTKVEVSFDTEEEDQAKAVEDAVRKMTNHQITVAQSIHPSTLASFARQQIEEDPTWDYERVGLTAFPIAKFTKKR